MGHEALKLALEALKRAPWKNWRTDNAITAIKEALAQPVQEPVAVVVADHALHWVGSGSIEPLIKKHRIKVGDKLYTAPQQRKWVGLTDDEIDYQAKKDDHGAYFALGALWAGAKLKEKNNGT